MKNALLSLLSFLLILGSNSCGESNNIKKEKRNYIYLFDTINDENVTYFENLFKHKINSDLEPLCQYQPDDFDDISFTIYLTTNFELTPICSISFTEKESNKKSRSKAVREFLSALKQNVNTKVKDRYILRSLESIISTLNSTTTNNEVFLISSLIENSGGAIREQNTFQNGNFKFVYDDETNTCNSEHFLEARRQINDSTSWVYSHLIDNELSTKKIIQKTSFNICKSFTNIQNNSNKNQIDCRFYQDFWNPLFKKIGLTIKKTQLSKFEYLKKNNS